MLQNRRFIQQSAWRVYAVHLIARLLGVLAHVEGMPIGSNRIYPRQFRAGRGGVEGDSGLGIEGTRI